MSRGRVDQVDRTTTGGPVAPTERVLAPDLARGLALLGIALANCVTYLSGLELGPLLRPVQASTADRAVDVAVGLLVDNRAFPMFTMLVAYGFVTVLRRQAAAGVPWPRARGLLVRRSAWLAAFGAAHLLLLFAGDILLAYGLLGLALVLVVRAEDRSLRLLGWATLPAFLLLGALDGLGLAATAPPTYSEDLTERAVTLSTTLVTAPFVVAALAPPAVVGVLLARRRVLEDPVRHVALLRRATLVGLPVSVLGAVPLVLMSTQTVQAPLGVRLVAAALHGGTGLLGAGAFLAGVGWFVAARQQRSRGAAPRSGAVRALAAVGERSLTCYLLQSALLVPLLSPWALGLGERTGTAMVSAVAVGVWAATLVVAVVLDRLGRSGPAEVLLRRLVYGARPSPSPAPSAPEAGPLGR